MGEVRLPLKPKPETPNLSGHNHLVLIYISLLVRATTQQLTANGCSVLSALGACPTPPPFSQFSNAMRIASETAASAAAFFLPLPCIQLAIVHV